MSRRPDRSELDSIVADARQRGRDAADVAPLPVAVEPGDARPAEDLPLPAGVSLEDLTETDVREITQAWLAGYSERGRERETGAEEGLESSLWWSPTVPGAWPKGWRYNAVPGAGRVTAGAIGGTEHLGRDADAAEIQRLASRGGAPDVQGIDWSTVDVRRGRGPDEDPPAD